MSLQHATTAIKVLVLHHNETLVTILPELLICLHVIFPHCWSLRVYFCVAKRNVSTAATFPKEVVSNKQRNLLVRSKWVYRQFECKWMNSWGDFIYRHVSLQKSGPVEWTQWRKSTVEQGVVLFVLINNKEVVL